MLDVMSMYVKNVTIAPGLPYLCWFLYYAALSRRAPSKEEFPY